jgi:EAL domain-containing protein (putative c-di-GMP-specific phosphodiesterase class I)
MGLPLTPIAINVSAIEFAKPDFILTVASTIESSGITLPFLELELTESMLMRNMTDVVDKLSQLKRLNVKVAIDDFGTGYSSLAYLQKLPLDVLKVDASFTHSLDSATESGNGRAIIEAIVALARSLKLSVVAEGVETESQRQILQEIGCITLQGYLFSHPRCAHEIEPMLRDQLRGEVLPARTCA